MGGSVFSSLREEVASRPALYAAGTACICAGAGLGVLVLQRGYERIRLAGETDRTTLTKKDVVYLFMPPRIGVVSNMSGFSMKLETWLRIVNIPYQFIETLIPSSKRAFPYVYLNEQELCDTHFIIEKLSKHFGVAIDPKLTDLEKSTSLAYMRMLEEHTVFAVAWYRYVHNPDEFWKVFPKNDKMGVLARKFLKYGPAIIKHGWKLKIWQQGLGRHSPEQIYSLCEADIRAVSNFLGDKKYLMGDEPTMVDAVVFTLAAHMAKVNIDFPPRQLLVKECDNLVCYVDRMLARFYPDWDQLCDV